ncbi:MAG: carbohydrate porin [Leptospirillia bacterium]
MATPTLAHEDEGAGAGHTEQVLHLTGAHPVSLGAGLTIVTQGVDGSDGARGGTTYSVDIALESEMGNGGTAFIYINSAQGTGAVTDPAGGNEPLSGINGDNETGDLSAEGYSETRVAEAWVNLPVGDMASLTVGKIDPTGIYDANEYANDETSQFLNGAFVNNLAIAFPGYVGGASLAVETGNTAVNLGVFESGGEFGGVFDDAFLVAEVAQGMEWNGLMGNARLTYWSTPSGNNNDNNGIALSIDQEVSETVGVFARYGTYDDDVTSGYDAAYSLGFQAEMEPCVVGVGYGALTAVSASADDEQVVEAYLSHSLSDNLTLTLDLQSITGANLSATVKDTTVFGARLQVDL